MRRTEKKGKSVNNEHQGELVLIPSCSARPFWLKARPYSHLVVLNILLTSKTLGSPCHARPFWLQARPYTHPVMLDFSGYKLDFILILSYSTILLTSETLHSSGHARPLSLKAIPYTHLVVLDIRVTNKTLHSPCHA